MNICETVHAEFIERRRIDVLVCHLKRLIMAGGSVLDVGCGDGCLAYRLNKERPDLSVHGIDVLIREKTWMPVRQFDGVIIPVDSDSVDVVMLIDVLHHAESPAALLGEAARVARKAIIIKDHLVDGFLAEPTLRLMDRIGNARYGVASPGNYWRRSQWNQAFERLALTPADWLESLGLYPGALDLFFGRSLHFMARLDVGMCPMVSC